MPKEEIETHHRPTYTGELKDTPIPVLADIPPNHPPPQHHFNISPSLTIRWLYCHLSPYERDSPWIFLPMFFGVGWQVFPQPSLGLTHSFTPTDNLAWTCFSLDMSLLGRPWEKTHPDTGRTCKQDRHQYMPWMLWSFFGETWGRYGKSKLFPKPGEEQGECWYQKTRIHSPSNSFAK